MAAQCEQFLFDLDGTLLDHDGASAAAVAALLPEWLPGAGVDLARATELWRGLERIHMAEYLDRKIDFQEQRRRRIRGLIDGFGGRPPLGDAAADACFAPYIEAYEQSWRPFADVSEAFERLCRAGARAAVFSNGDRDQQRAKLAALGLPFPLVLLVPADVGAAKPDVRAFRGACERLGWEPRDVAYLGDSFESDVRGSADSGLQACWINRTAALPPPGSGTEYRESRGLRDALSSFGIGDKPSTSSR